MARGPVPRGNCIPPSPAFHAQKDAFRNAIHTGQLSVGGGVPDGVDGAYSGYFHPWARTRGSWATCPGHDRGVGATSARADRPAGRARTAARDRRSAPSRHGPPRAARAGPRPARAPAGRARPNPQAEVRAGRRPAAAPTPSGTHSGWPGSLREPASGSPRASCGAFRSPDRPLSRVPDPVLATSFRAQVRLSPVQGW